MCVRFILIIFPLSLLQLLAERQAHQLNYPPSRFLQPTGSSWNNFSVRPRNVHTHLRLSYHRCVHEGGSNADPWDKWYDKGNGSRMGGTHRPDSADTAQSTCGFMDYLIVSHFHDATDCRRHKYLHDTAMTTLKVPRQYMRSMLHLPLLPTPSSMPLGRRCMTHLFAGRTNRP